MYLHSSNNDEGAPPQILRKRLVFVKPFLATSLSGSLLRIALITTILTTGLFINFPVWGTHAYARASTSTFHVAHFTNIKPQTFTGVRKPHLNLPTMAVPNPAPHYSSLKTKMAPAKIVKATIANGTTPLDGMGDLPLYAYIDKQLSNLLDMKVNVANGNLILHTTELQIAGTGINLNLGGYYDSQDNGWLLDHGTNWNFTIGRGATLDLSNLSQGVTLHGPSGYTAFFVANGTDTNGTPLFKDNQGLGASVSYDTSTNRYWIMFHNGGETWGFDHNGTWFGDFDKNLNGIGFNYNAHGDLTGITDTQGRSLSVAENSQYQITSITDNTNRTITYGYDFNANLTSIICANGKQTTFTYNPNSQLLTSITDPNGNTTTITYTSNGKVQTITDANSTNPGVTKFTYNTGNTVVTDTKRNPITYTYNSQLEVTSSKNTLGYVNNRTFDTTNYNVQSITDAQNNIASYSYNNNNSVTKYTDATGAVTRYAYPQSLTSSQASNILYDPLSLTNTQNNETDLSYDNNGNLLSTTNKTNQQGVQYTYDQYGDVTSQVDANGNVTLNSYDSKGRLTSITPAGPVGQTTLTYDALSRLSTLTDGQGQTTKYSYDTMDHILQVTYNYGANSSYSISYTYDNDGNQLTQTDNTGTTSYKYDALNRQIQKTLPGGTSIVSGYDASGNLTSYNDGTGVVSYGYDQVNQMTSLTEPDGSTTTYGYDKDGNRTNILYPNGTGMLLAYDAIGREISNKGGKITINTSGQPTVSTIYTNFNYYYTPSGSSSSQTDLAYEISLDPVMQTQTTMFKQVYSYNSQNELSEVDKYSNADGSKMANWNATYDGVGNRTELKYSGTTIITKKPVIVASTVAFDALFTYNAANELTNASNTGNTDGTTTSGSATYSYDGNGNLTNVVSTNGGPLTPNQTHTYNASNQDVSGSGSVGGNNNNNYGYSGGDQTERVINNSNTDVYGQTGLTSSKNSSGTTSFVRCSCGLLNNERTPDGKKYYYLFDKNDSVVGMTDSSGNDVNRYAYDPFGNDASHVEQSGINNPWRYDSGYYDSSTGLTKFGIRYYDSKSARWTQRDPIGGSLQEITKANPYVYANNDPINYVDPSGANGILCFFSLIFFGMAIGVEIQGMVAWVTGLLVAFAWGISWLAGPFGYILAAVAGIVGLIIWVAFIVYQVYQLAGGIADGFAKMRYFCRRR